MYQIKSLGAKYYEADEATKAKMRKELFDPFFKNTIEELKSKYPHSKLPDMRIDDVTADMLEELGCISLNVTYKLYQRICNNLGIRLSRDAMKGTHSFRRNKATTMSTNGAPATLISDYLGNSPQVLDSNYRLTTRSAKEALKYQETKKYLPQ